MEKTGNGNLKFVHVGETNVRTLRVCLHRKSRDTTRETWRSKGELKLTPHEQLAEEETLVTWSMATTPKKIHMVLSYWYWHTKDFYSQGEGGWRTSKSSFGGVVKQKFKSKKPYRQT